jgi:UDP-N-acetylmuramate dehydrogenase
MNTFGMKVKARCFMEYDSVTDLVDIEFEELARPVLHIGGGSNLLFTDDFKGTILHSKINFIEILDDCHFDRAERVEKSVEPVLVSVGAGVVFDDFCDWAAKEGLWGVENLSYIPGEVGASAVQNIGAYGVEVKDVIKTVYCYDTVEEEFVSFDVEDCEYGYRDSVFKDPEIKGRYIVTHVVFALSRTPQPRLDYGHLHDAVIAASARHCEEGQSPDVAIFTPSLIRKVIIKIRKEKLPEPSVMGSAGSFFKNPVISAEHFARIEAAAKAEFGEDYKVPHYVVPADCHSIPEIPASPSAEGSCVEAGEKQNLIKIPAAWMIEQCGWKGRRSGGAAVYDKQPLVIVNYTGEAFPEEIIGLERRIVESVRKKFGVELHPEVEHI